MGVLPDIVVPNSPPKRKELMDLAEKMKRAIEDNTIPLHKALQMALALEESIADIYFNELLMTAYKCPITNCSESVMGHASMSHVVGHYFTVMNDW